MALPINIEDLLNSVTTETTTERDRKTTEKIIRLMKENLHITSLSPLSYRP